jgi:hypothetical protein
MRLRNRRTVTLRVESLEGRCVPAWVRSDPGFFRIGIQDNTSYVFPFQRQAAIVMYWFSLNWKFAFGALAGDGFDASEITL